MPARPADRVLDGFLQPINDTAHQTSATTSTFKAGTTVPVTFQLETADGKAAQGAAAPEWLNPVKGSTAAAPLHERVYTEAATSGRRPGTSTSTRGCTAGYYYRIGLKLEDGQTSG